MHAGWQPEFVLQQLGQKGLAGDLDQNDTNVSFIATV